MYYFLLELFQIYNNLGYESILLHFFFLDISNIMSFLPPEINVPGVCITNTATTYIPALQTLHFSAKNKNAISIFKGNLDEFKISSSSSSMPFTVHLTTLTTHTCIKGWRYLGKPAEYHSASCCFLLAITGLPICCLKSRLVKR